jgi:hypothetical protein
MQLSAFFQPGDFAQPTESTSTQPIKLMYRGGGYQRDRASISQVLAAGSALVGTQLIYRGSAYQIATVPTVAAAPSRQVAGQRLTYRGASYVI